MTSNKSSRLSRHTIKYDLFISSFFSHLSSILLFFKSINHIAKRIFITSMKYFIVKNFYTKFHKKFKLSSFVIIENNLQFVFFFDQMSHRQMRITFYFKSIDSSHNHKSKIKLLFNRKYVDSKAFDQSTWISNLTSSNSILNKTKNHMQQFIFNDKFHKHIDHNIVNIKRWFTIFNNFNYLTLNFFENVSFASIFVNHFIHQICRRCTQRFIFDDKS